MNPKNKLAEMPVRPLLYTMAVPLMLSLLIQSLYNIVDSIFVARLSETALTAASLVSMPSISTMIRCLLPLTIRKIRKRSLSRKP